jgi:hypothetical protein
MTSEYQGKDIKIYMTLEYQEKHIKMKILHVHLLLYYILISFVYCSSGILRLYTEDMLGYTFVSA